MAYPNQLPPPPPPQTMGSTNTVFITETRFDPSYVKTLPGIIKVVVIVLNLIGFICIQSSAFWSNGRGVYFNIVAHLGLWFSGGLLVLYLFHIVEKYHNIKWLKIEMIAYIVMVFLYLIASTIVVAFGAAAYSAAGFFGYLAMVVYGGDAFLKYKALKAGELAQGHRVLAKQTHVTTPPALP
ncbi:CKLF-like MARVEL transmembrane domain-containing protein 4 [Trichoplusia ni]|uniref:CKLF-like MARVEL transmembrane domain-containing protein 4 n=1 Tax=Trichoplusia ni TaxID=7111 RepID=A0A7E5WCJ3_TRINI|nr:CKLF-like MARVEL transmembrane domain-containing protein 4 [Trichoplusia ni]XP_026738442.1 CKLF-like MARVEL transmembrane domain-containing protein 4 [Trichoplusia ni]XP_026738443.1 CKLF-like MARVEL transmembrane domain-containing protein 4 [Trichoplusia ni]XP_026738444.1 CKLF-like MARVEL transmembrane domain-containing protein 4 [Trichoplusia ni]